MTNEKNFIINRIFNHNVVLVQDSVSHREIVLLGKGIGFGQKIGNTLIVDDLRIEKRFHLENESHQKQYQTILNQIDHAVIGIAEEIITLIAQEITPHINEHIHVALPDHIQFAIYRLRSGMEIVNPFLFEIETLYSKEFQLARRAATMIKEAFTIEIPDSEIGFLALHIHSAVSYLPVAKAVQFTNVISDLVEMIERKTGKTIERTAMDYVRLITHLRFALERIRQHKSIQNPLLNGIKSSLPEPYALAEKLAELISEKLDVVVPEDEIGYMAMHVFRLLQQT